jgi:hypothetical protein
LLIGDGNFITSKKAEAKNKVKTESTIKINKEDVFERLTRPKS